MDVDTAFTMKNILLCFLKSKKVQYIDIIQVCDTHSIVHFFSTKWKVIFIVTEQLKGYYVNSIHDFQCDFVFKADHVETVYVYIVSSINKYTPVSFLWKHLYIKKNITTHL